MKRKTRDFSIYGLIWFCAALAVSMLILIIGYIFIRGVPAVSLDFLTNDYNSKTSYVYVSKPDSEFSRPEKLEDEIIFLTRYGVGITLETGGDKGTILKIAYVDSSSPFASAKTADGAKYPVKAGYEITKISSGDVSELSAEDIRSAFSNADKLRLRVVSPGGGIYPMIVTTLMTVLLSLLIAIPIGVLAAIYLVEYAKQGKLLNIIRFTTESLAGIPSIVFGLFGMLFFVKFMGIGQSILAGSMTLGIILLPTVIRTTEETLKTIPESFKEASFGLGANRLQTLRRIILPGSIPGILVAVILSIGRIVGESAALLFTAGTFAQMPKGIFDTASTLTVRAYMEVKEYGNIEMASGIGVVLITIVLILNISVRLISNRFVNRQTAKKKT